MIYYVGTFPCDSNYLEHHGIKGQKWGVRRYQNADGTLTEEGRKRYLNEHYGENSYSEYVDIGSGLTQKGRALLDTYDNRYRRDPAKEFKDANKILKKFTDPRKFRDAMKETVKDLIRNEAPRNLSQKDRARYSELKKKEEAIRREHLNEKFIFRSDYKKVSKELSKLEDAASWNTLEKVMAWIPAQYKDALFPYVWTEVMFDPPFD